MAKYEWSTAGGLVKTITVMLHIANYVEAECNKGNRDVLQIGYGAKAIADYLRDGVKDILTLQQAYDGKMELLGMRNAECKEFEDCLKGIFGECDPEQIEYILNEDDLKAIKEIYGNAVNRYEEKEENE
jgi:hypothetical protein